MRKEIEIELNKKEEDGRDTGKKFKITEMPAYQMERWAIRALGAIGKSQAGGVMALASMGLQDVLNAFATADFEKTEPLMNELMECCYFIKGDTTVQLKKEFVDGVVEEWATLLRLKMEALKLNLGFLEQGDGLDTK